MSAVRDLDFVYENFVGGFGKWQLKTTLYLWPPSITAGLVLFLTVFSTYSPNHRCFIPECDTTELQVQEDFVSFAIPQASGHEYLKKSKLDSCHVFGTVPGSKTCEPSSFNSSDVRKCDEYVWDRSQWGESLTTINNLVCDQDNVRRLSGTVLLSGILVGSIIGGKIGDLIGRKKTMIVAVIITIVTSFINGFITNFPLYLAVYFVMAISIPMNWIAQHSLGIEFFDPGHRKFIVALKDLPLPALTFTLLAHLTRHWAYLHFAAGAVSLLFLPSLFLVPESPRWLTSNGKTEEALEVFKDIAKGNGKVLSEKELDEINDILDEVRRQTDKEQLGPIHMFKKGYASRTLILFLAWSMVSLGSYSLTLSSTTLSGDIILNYLLIVLSDLPVALFVYFLLDIIGRPKMLALANFILGGSAIVIALVSKSQSIVILIFYIFGKFGAGIGFVMVYTITGEVYPTNMRTQALGCCSMVARIASMGSSFIPKLALIWGPLPMLTLGIPTVIAGLLVLLLPETTDVDLPQSFNEGIELMDVNHDTEEQK